MLVMKFGGSSVANAEQIEKVRAIVAGRRARNPVVVSSAHKGITNALIAAAHEAARGSLAPEVVIEKQAAIVESLGGSPELLAPFYRDIRDLLRGISLVAEVSPRSLDYISSFGERMSVRAIADYFTRNGLPARAFDVWDLGFITDDEHGSARPLPGFEARVHDAFATLARGDFVPVITGFVGKNRAGVVTTVGRNGSDLTATLLASALQADEVEIWTDTDGVMTADPSVVDEVQNIPRMRFDEAAELAYFGSQVLHPSTLLPAMSSGIPVRVLNTNRPDHPGTVISEDAPSDRNVTSIAYKEGQCALSITSTAMFGVAGYLGSIFSILAKHGVVVDLISTSEISVSVTSNDEAKINAALPELKELGQCSLDRNRAILAVVGQQLAGKAGLGAQCLEAIASAGVSVEMISYGMNSINFTMLIADEDIPRAVPVLHRVLFRG